VDLLNLIEIFPNSLTLKNSNHGTLMQAISEFRLCPLGTVPPCDEEEQSYKRTGSPPGK
jgi:hypothetical protein